MKYAFVIAAVALAIGVVAFVTYRLLRVFSRDFGGFRDWVKNPDYRQAAADYFDARSSLTVPTNISDAQIRKMVGRLFIERDRGFNYDRLRLVGAKATPFLIEALEDPKTARTKFSKHVHMLEAQTPFERICRLLGEIGPSSAVLPLAKYFGHEDKHFRKLAALALGQIGTAECIDPIQRALSDEDESVQAYAMIGIQRGIESNRACSEFLEGVFPAIQELLTPCNSLDGKDAASLLLAIDTGRAMRVLLSDQYFTVENEELSGHLAAINDAGQKIPLTLLLPLLETVRPLADTYPHDYEYAEALIAYAQNPDGSAERTIRAGLDSTSDRVRKGAARALVMLSGVSDAQDVLFDRVQQSGFNALSPAQRHYFAILTYDSQVRNGGHAQYFVNSSGRYWKHAIDGLVEIGANGRADILKTASALFEKDGPSEDDGKRHTQISRFRARDEKTLGELDSQYFASNESIDVLLALYAIEHKDDFTATS